MTGQLLTVREAATLTGRSVAYVRRLLNDGQVRGRKDRGRWYVNRGSLDVWVACGSPDPDPPAKFYVCPEVVKIRGRGSSDYLRARGAVPRAPGAPSPEDAIRRGRDE